MISWEKVSWGCGQLFALQRSSFLPSCLTPAGLVVCAWHKQMLDHTIQDVHPPLLWAASLNASVFRYIYSSMSSWQLLRQLLPLFRDRPLLAKLFPDLHKCFWFISAMFLTCGKSGSSIKEQRYNYVRVLFALQEGQSENLQGYLFVFWQWLVNA